jgi:hypothetical protein
MEYSNVRKATPEEKASNMNALTQLLAAYPNLTEDKIGDFLMNATAFPFNSLPDAVKQAIEYAEASGGDYEKAINLSNEEFDKNWEATRPEREKLGREEEEKKKDPNRRLFKND